jgi:hypothetical protein
MTPATVAQTLWLVAAGAFGGLGVGLAYFSALRRGVDLCLGGRGLLLPAALTLGRLAVAACALTLAARCGPVALGAALAGFVAARTLALRAAGSERR